MRRFLNVCDRSSSSVARGKLLVGEPYFVPGHADHDRPEGAEGRRARRSRLGQRGPRAGACRAGDRPGEGDRERPRGAARREGAAGGLRAARPSEAELRGPNRPARPAHVHDRPRDREGLRRCDLGTSRGRGPARLGAHRRRLVLRAGGIAARPRRRRAGELGVRAGARRADASALARRRRLLAAAERGPAHGHGRDSLQRRPRAGRARVLPVGDPQQRAAHATRRPKRSSPARKPSPSLPRRSA